MSTSKTLDKLSRMERFVIHEAELRAREIDAETINLSSTEKLHTVQSAMNRLVSEHELKLKSLEQQRLIAISGERSKRSLEYYNARDGILNKVKLATRQKLLDLVSREDEYVSVLTVLIQQASEDFKHLGTAVVVFREEDKAFVEKAVKALDSPVNVVLHETSRLRPAPATAEVTPLTCLGGVVLESEDGRIKSDNTFDTRIERAWSVALPAVRKELFE